MLSFGSVSIIALISFFFGKIWSSSEAVFEKRQIAYATFIKTCPHSTEILIHLTLDREEHLMTKIREAYSEVCLYASKDVLVLADLYIRELGQLISIIDNCELAEAQVLVANGIYMQMLESMRRDALGFTWFGVLNRVNSFKKSWPSS
ncbi:MAG: hypothetical protein JJ938_03610 [Roseicyclus sp.]|nr:hypothetical protein [Roseicyclus sp.]MBO6623942.1 hypothetical protein [Roseicyclus sp.]MBO6923049.1 hypothetical protein [Roseicyclus sp.]